jgi:F0F1-type ATP synthase assembly protein I
MASQQQKPHNDGLRELAPLMNMGMELAITVGVFGGIGWLIDKYAQTSPLWFAVLLVLGVISGMVKMLRTALKFSVKSRSVGSVPLVVADKVTPSSNPDEPHKP